MYLSREEALARDTNRMAILRHLCTNPGTARRALADALDVPLSTIAGLVSGLLEEGWLEKREAPPSGQRGRTPAGLYVQPDRLVLLSAEIRIDRLGVVARTLASESLANDETAHVPGTSALVTAAKLLVRMQARVYSPERRVICIHVRACVGGSEAGLVQQLGELLRGTPLRGVPLRMQGEMHGGQSLPEPVLGAVPARLAAAGHTATAIARDRSASLPAADSLVS
ncbi:MAG: hypothetical protein EOP39_11075 [Rubrivivax sp.]|nr:MAG: hypothetical protein EOP39_11075 [Rubrivivax sp.]